MEVVDYIYKPYTKTICFFGKCIRNSQKDCQFWTSEGLVNDINALWVERFFDGIL